VTGPIDPEGRSGPSFKGKRRVVNVRRSLGRGRTGGARRRLAPTVRSPARPDRAA